jgi:c-di-GMP-binding flagellar brake protein YcgR
MTTMSVMQREKRVSLQLRVEVHGEDASGARFTEITRSVNVSGGGICFESHRQISIGALLELVIELPASLRRHFGDRDVYHARAVVCRVERFEGEEARRVSARFLGEVPGEMV